MKETCAQALNYLIQILKKLDFAINWGKCVDLTDIIAFLGIELDSLTMSLSLPEDKITMFRKELHSFLQLRRVTKRQLQSIAGQLSWAAGVVSGGEFFSR